jgi:hypothetical protein
MATGGMQRLPYQPSDEASVLPRNTRSLQEDRAMLDYQPQPQPRQQQQPRRRQPKPPRLPLEDINSADAPPPVPTARPRRKRSPSPAPTRPRALPTTTALLAGSLTAYRVRGEAGPWRKKALRVAASAGTAALASLSFEGGAREDGRVAEGAWGVAVPVMAGIGAERIFWGQR